MCKTTSRYHHLVSLWVKNGSRMPKIILHQSEFPTLLLVRAILMRNFTTLHSDLRHLRHLIKVTKRSGQVMYLTNKKTNAIKKTCLLKVLIAKLSFKCRLAEYFHFPFGCLSPWWRLHLSPSYDVLDHTNYIFSEGLSSGPLTQDKYRDKDTQTQTRTDTKCFQDPMYAIFIKSREFKDWKCDIGCLLLMTKTKTKTKRWWTWIWWTWIWWTWTWWA